jgi:predicted RNase H-like nuclease
VERAVAGVDGCRGGWVVVTVPLGARAAARVDVVPGLVELADDLLSGRLAAAAIDIPIGLPTRGSRAADVAARRRLGARRSSVFPAPLRAVLGARTYPEACAISRRIWAKGVSKQLFNILDKIRAVDDLQSPVLQRHLVEMCPELSFTVLAGSPMRHPKRTAEGRAERLRALGAAFAPEDVCRHADAPPAGAKPDDVIDAFVGAWTARRYLAGAHVRLGGELDDTGLRMEVIA